MNSKSRWFTPAVALLVAAAAVLIGVPLRTFQLSRQIDPETGFWNTANSVSMWVLYALVLIVILASFVLIRFSRKLPKPDFPEERSIFLGVFGTLASIGFLADFVQAVLKAVSVKAETDPFDPYYGSSLMSTGFIPMLLEAVFAFLSAAYFVFYTVSQFRGDSFYRNRLVSILAMNPILWAIARLLRDFLLPIKFKNVSQLFLEILFLCFAALALFAFARISAQVGQERSSWVLCFCGTTALFLGYVTALAPVLLFLTGNGEKMTSAYPLHIADFTTALFLTGLLIHMLPGEKEETISAHPDAEARKAARAAEKTGKPAAVSGSEASDAAEAPEEPAEPPKVTKGGRNRKKES